MLQALSYAYDPVGNVTSIANSTVDTVYFNNVAVPGSGAYVYDALYRLIGATGREHTAGDAPPDWTDSPRLNLPYKADGDALQNYRELYAYDRSGNLTRIRHNGGRGWLSLRWTRDFSVDAAGNQLATATVGSSTKSFGYDPSGNLVSSPHLDTLDWNEDNQLVHVRTHAGDDVHYAYDSEGHRVRKFIARSDGTTEERLYVGRWERYFAKRGDGSTRVQRETLHVLDGEKRIALVERRTAGSDAGSDRLVAYQYGNALGSALLELDESSAILSYEEYHPYGSTALQSVSTLRRTPSKRYEFTAKERDNETGFYYHGSRYMAPWLCRWTSPDPSGVADGANMYTYAGNRPIGSSDPTGNWELPNWRTVAVVTAVLVVGAVVTVATAGAAAPIVAGALSGLGGTLATVSTGVVVGAVSGAVGGAVAGAAGELTRQTVNSRALGLGNERFDVGLIGREAASGARTGALVGAAAGGIAALASTAVGTAAVGAAGRVGRALAQRVVPGAVRQAVATSARAVATLGQRAAGSSTGQLVQRGAQALARRLDVLERAALNRGGQAASAIFREGSEGARVAAAVSRGSSVAEAFGVAPRSLNELAAAHTARGPRPPTLGTAEELGIPRFLSPRQSLHLPPVSGGRSVLTANPQELLEGLHQGSFTILRQPKPGQIVVDFGRPIGEFWSSGVRVGETRFGSVLFGKRTATSSPPTQTNGETCGC